MCVCGANKKLCARCALWNGCDVVETDQTTDTDMRTLMEIGGCCWTPTNVCIWWWNRAECRGFHVPLLGCCCYCWNVWMGQRRQPWSSLSIRVCVCCESEYPYLCVCGYRCAVNAFEFFPRFFRRSSLCACIAWSTYNNHATIVHICTTHRRVIYDSIAFFLAIFSFFLCWLPIGGCRILYTQCAASEKESQMDWEREREGERAPYRHTRACVMCIFESSKCGGLSMRRTHFVYIQIYLIFMAVLVCLCM